MDLKKIIGKREELENLQKILEEAPDYFKRATGQVALKGEAKHQFKMIPENFSYDNKFFYGIYINFEMIGCIDILRGYPDKYTAMLGLLLISEKYQGKNYGKLAYDKLEYIIKKWGNIRKIRIGVLKSNNIVIPFWERRGFIKTGEIQSYEYNEFKTELMVLEKKLL